MKTYKFLAPIFIAGLLLANVAHADAFGTAVGGGFGAVTGVIIGDSMGGRNGAIIGSGIGGALGAVVGQSVSSAPSGYGYPPVVYGSYAVIRPAPVVVERRVAYYYPEPDHRHGHGYARGHYKDHHHGHYDGYRH